jgi:hypothetical protein
VQALSNAGLDVPMNGAGVSPQRALGLAVTHPDDIFALGAITFQVLYARPLDDRSRLKALITPLASVDHVKLEEVLEGALSEDPEDRPASALQFAAALQRVLITGPEPEIPIPISRPAAAAAAIDDLPLRAEQPSALAFEPSMVDSASVSEPRYRVAESESASRTGFIWLALTVGLAIGLLGGFAAGFVVGQRDSTPAPRRAERAVPRAQREPPPEPTPSAVVGQDFTESTVPPTAVDEPEVKTPESVDRPVAERTGRSDASDRPEPSEQFRGAERTDRVDPTVPASIEVVSRPSGAHVFVNGRLVGRTPLVLSAMRPGAHAVRIALPGHQRWVTTVDVAAGSRARVAASLER